MVLLEEELDKLEERCKVATEKMEEATVNCDESERYKLMGMGSSLKFSLGNQNGFNFLISILNKSLCFPEILSIRVFSKKFFSTDFFVSLVQLFLSGKLKRSGLYFTDKFHVFL